jgi:type I restriction enzyme S subunit
MIDELKAYKQSVITEAVCKGLDKSVPMKDSGIEWIGEVPEGWKIRKVKTLSIMINGYAFDSQKFGLNNKNKVLRIGDIFDGVINREITTNIDDVIELEKYILQENDIVIALSGATVGKIGYVNNLNNEKIYVNQRVGIIRADNHKLLFYFLQSNVFRKYVELLSWGSAQPNISLNQIGEFKIPFSVSDGLSIVSYLDQKCSQIDTLISIKQQKIDELKEYKKSMIYEYITGKKQVPNE